MFGFGGFSLWRRNQGPKEEELKRPSILIEEEEKLVIGQKGGGGGGIGFDSGSFGKDKWSRDGKEREGGRYSLMRLSFLPVPQCVDMLCLLM